MSPESNRPFVHSAISQSARSISSDTSTSVPLTLQKVGWEPCQPLPRGSPCSHSFHQFGCPAHLVPRGHPQCSLHPYPLHGTPLTRAGRLDKHHPSWDHGTCSNGWVLSLVLGGLRGKRLFFHWWPAQGPSRYRSLGRGPGERAGHAWSFALPSLHTKQWK